MATALDGFRALNPSDGLFLRAEHLETIQSYAQSLAFATATTAGTGVAHGLGVTLSDDGTKLRVTPGLAVSPAGRLLHLRSALTVPLDAEHLPTRRNDGFWVVELHWATGTSGSANVYGSLCDDGSGAGTIRPWRDEGVEVRLVADSLRDLDTTPPDVRRSWLASAYFERERGAGQPWLVPARKDAAVRPLSQQDWGDATALPSDTGVPLAVLQKADVGYQLDVWTARRLLDTTAAQASWRHRLAMRPWSVFLAQLLQLEDQLAGSGALGRHPDPKRLVVLDVAVEESLRRPVERFIKEIADTPVVRWHQYKELLEAARAPAPQRGTLTASPSLRGLGLVELPPAGYLEVDEGREDLMELMAEFFGQRVELRRRDLRADQVADAVQRAQHADRIPLDATRARPQVDVLVPSQEADKPDLYAAAYGWVAFVRRPPVDDVHDIPEIPDIPDIPEQKWEEVAAYVHWSEGDQLPEDLFGDGELGESERIGRLTYPAGGWDFPDGDAAAHAREWIHKQGWPYAVVGLAAGEERLPLAALRASLFAASLDHGVHFLPVHAFASASEKEAIILLFRPQMT